MMPIHQEEAAAVIPTTAAETVAETAVETAAEVIRSKRTTAEAPVAEATETTTTMMTITMIISQYSQK